MTPRHDFQVVQVQMDHLDPSAHHELSAEAEEEPAQHSAGTVQPQPRGSSNRW